MRSSTLGVGGAVQHLSPDEEGAPTSRRTTVRDVAERSLRGMVLAGRFPPGSRLNEVALANELGISRGPLREAIQMLASDGLLRIVRHRGAFVRTLNRDELRELYGLRIALETYAVRSTISNDVGRPQEPLESLLAQTSEAFVADGAYPPDFDFHQSLVALARNRTLEEAARDVHARVYLARARSAHDPDRARAAFDEHRRIVEAIRDRDAELASGLLEEHLWASYAKAALILDDDRGASVGVTSPANATEEGNDNRAGSDASSC